jgi:hypothetical protein
VTLTVGNWLLCLGAGSTGRFGVGLVGDLGFGVGLDLLEGSLGGSTLGLGGLWNGREMNEGVHWVIKKQCKRYYYYNEIKK